MFRDQPAIDLVQDPQALGLLGERLLVLRVVDRDGRLIGESLEQRDLRLVELSRRGTSHGQDADHLAPDAQGYGEAGDDTDLDIALAELAVELEAHVSPDVRAPHRTTLGGRPPHQADTG